LEICGTYLRERLDRQGIVFERRHIWPRAGDTTYHFLSGGTWNYCVRGEAGWFIEDGEKQGRRTSVILVEEAVYSGSAKNTSLYVDTLEGRAEVYTGAPEEKTGLRRLSDKASPHSVFIFDAVEGLEDSLSPSLLAEREDQLQPPVLAARDNREEEDSESLVLSGAAAMGVVGAIPTPVGP